MNVRRLATAFAASVLAVSGLVATTTVPAQADTAWEFRSTPHDTAWE
jgi:hypothetical protein